MPSNFTTAPLFFVLFSACFFIGCFGVLILRHLRLKRGRYQLTEGRVISVDYAIDKLRSLSQKGYSVQIEYFVNGETYSLFIGSRHYNRFSYTRVTPLKSYRLGEKVELIFDTKNPDVAFRKRSPYLYLFIVISTVMLVFSIITIIV